MTQTGYTYFSNFFLFYQHFVSMAIRHDTNFELKGKSQTTGYSNEHVNFRTIFPCL